MQRAFGNHWVALPDFILFGVESANWILLFSGDGGRGHSQMPCGERGNLMQCLLFSRTFFCLPVFITLHCLRHVAVMEVAMAVISCGCGDFLHYGTLSLAKCRVCGGWGVCPVRSSLSSCLPSMWYYCSVVRHSEGKLSWWRPSSPMKSLSTPFCFSVQGWRNLDGRFCYIAEVTFHFWLFSCIKKPSNLGG